MSSLAACPACAVAPLAEETAKAALKPSLHLSVPAIHCAACIGKIERALMALPEVEAARVNLSLKRVVVSGDNLDPDQLAVALGAIGFDAYPLDGAVLDGTPDSDARAILMRLAVAGFAMMNVMLLSVAVWSGAEGATRDLFHLISAAIALPVVIFAAQPFFASGLSALKVGQLNMDVPISLAIALAAGMSLYETFQGGAHAYFDAALSLTFFLLIGRYLDLRTRNAARSAAKELAALEVQTAQVRRGDTWNSVAVSDLRIGDRILIATGMRVPVDGTLSTPNAVVDRSFLTGESAIVSLRQGALVQAGEINQGAPFEAIATAVGEDTTLRRMTALVERAENVRSTYTALADRAARIYAPLVHILALLAFIAWVWISGDVRLSLNIAIAVLIITCPCALGLAVPAVATAAIGRLYAHGFLVKHDTALERLAEVDTVVFDKTGTLTLPGPVIDRTQLGEEAAAVLAALAQASRHPVSISVAKALEGTKLAPVRDIEEVPGCGVRGIFKGELVRFGKAGWLGAGFDGTGFQIGDLDAVPVSQCEKLREGALEAVAALKAGGFRVVMMSGDTEHAVFPVSKALGIEEVHAGISSQEKYEKVVEMAARGQRVAMVGDGLNDTAALAAAHASIAPARALDASRTAADVVVLGDSFAGLPEIFEVSRATTRLSKQNFAIAALYNLIAVPIALLGFATPLLAALAMSTSSLSVLINALRVRWQA